MTSTHEIEAVAQLISPVALDVKDATVTLDEKRRPFGEVALTCSLMDDATLDLLDPREDVRIVVNLSRDGETPRAFDLLLHDRRVDHTASEIALTLRTDEAILIDAALVDDEADTSNRASGASLRTVINNVLGDFGAALEPGAADADMTVTHNTTNLFDNPTAGTNTTSGTATNCTLSRQSGVVAVGRTSFRLASPTTNDSFLTVTGYAALQAGHTYIVSGSIFLTGALGGTTHARARSIYLTYSGGGTAISSAAANTAGTTRLSLEFTVPAGQTVTFIRFYNGHSSGTAEWFNLRVSEKGNGDNTDYFDGAGAYPADAHYSYAWTGTANNSTSTRTRLDTRSDDLLDWQPGQSAWDFLAPMVEAADLRLYCDELRQWWLVESDALLPGLASISEGSNMTRAEETISRSSDEWYDSVIVRYRWADSAGVVQDRFDAAAGPGLKVLLEERSTPYPGPGAAESIRKRGEGRGRQFDVSAISRYDVTPWMAVQILAPNTDLQTGVVQAVEWRFPDDEMALTSRALTDTPAGAIDLLAGTIDSLTSTIDSH